MPSKEYRFKTPNGVIAHGYEATTLATIIEAVLASWQAKKLHHSQMHIVGQCALLSAGFMRAGIVALIDEHTQVKKIQENETFDGFHTLMRAPSSRGIQETFCLHLEALALWLLPVE